MFKLQAALSVVRILAILIYLMIFTDCSHLRNFP